MTYNGTDPIILAAQARPVIQKLHKHDDIVVRFKTDKSGYHEDAVDDVDRSTLGGHFRADKKVLALNLDELIPVDKPSPRSLSSVEDFRAYPVLAGVAAHEAGHARWSLWDELPESIPNPDFDPFAVNDEDGNNPTGPESYPVSIKGKLYKIAEALEEPRIERLGVSTYTKTWRQAMQYSAGHLILERIEEMDKEDEEPVEAAVGMCIFVGGRKVAGTLGVTYESRKSVKKVLESAQKIIEKAVEDMPEDRRVKDPYHVIMGIVSKHVFNNDHEDAVSHLEAARQILKIIHPEQADDPDDPGNKGGGGDEDEEEGDKGDGSAMPGSGESSAALKEMADAMRGAADGMVESLKDFVKSEEEMPEDEKERERGGHGSVLYKNPRAPQISRYEQPNADDRELYRRALDWMQKQIEPTITEGEYGQWLPVGGARLDLRSRVRDDMAGHRGSQRSDWNRVSETVKPAPPVKVAIMLDGSGSMSHMARPSASIAWAAANAAAALPESRTVSVVYGAAAQMTQEPGRAPAKEIAVSRTDGPTEEFIGAAKIVSDALWLDEPTEDGEPTNTLIIIISDLQYGGAFYHPDGHQERQMAGFCRITKEWAEKGYQVVVVGASTSEAREMVTYYNREGDVDEAMKNFTIKRPEELFR